VIAGLGMGLALYNGLLRPAVRRITVVERDPEIVALFEKIRGSEWPAADRVAIEIADALMWRATEPGDYLYADIRDLLGTPEAAAQTGRLGRGLDAG
jgi:spermidine synthase